LTPKPDSDSEKFLSYDSDSASDSENFYFLTPTPTPVPTPKNSEVLLVKISDLSCILVVKFYDAQMDEKTNERIKIQESC